MPQTNSLTAEARQGAGTGAARALRRAGRVPAVVYGGGEAPVSVSIEPRELMKAMHRPGFFATLVDLSLDGAAHRVLPREVQMHPVTDQPLHVDFLRVGADTELEVDIPVQFINEDECPGLRRGGLLNVVRHEIEVVCRADNIPQQLVVDLAGLEIGDSVHISAVALPDGVRPSITDRDFTVATIAAPTVVSEEAAEAAAAEAEEGVELAEGEEAPEGEAETKEESED